MAEGAAWFDGRGDAGTPIKGDPAEVFVQYKGTDICLDFRCDCGAQGHFDGYFAYVLRCSNCGATYEMPPLLYPRRVTPHPQTKAIEMVEVDGPPGHDSGNTGN